MSVLLVGSSQPRVGRSTVASALAYRFARAGTPVTLARLAGDDSAGADARTFASLEQVAAAGGSPLSIEDLRQLASAHVVVEAPPGPVAELADRLNAKVVEVRSPSSPRLDGATGAIVTGVAADDVTAFAAQGGVLAALPEDRTLACPSASDIADALQGKWLVEAERHDAIGRVMIGTVASDAASPYFAGRERTCVITRYDKTDIQLAALLTDVELLVLTGGGQPSPYLLDRVAGAHDQVSVLLAQSNTLDAMRSIEGLFGRSRFEGQGKLERAVELLDQAGVSIHI
jgi:BioD-like phosphotransacetylase family protein